MVTEKMVEALVGDLSRSKRRKRKNEEEDQ